MMEQEETEMNSSKPTPPNHLPSNKAAGLSTEQKQKYARDGWGILPARFTADECDGLIQHMDAVHAGEISVVGFVPPEENADHLIDVDQCHIHDPVCRDFMLHP